MDPNPLDYASRQTPGRRTNPWVAAACVIVFLFIVYILFAPYRPRDLQGYRISAAQTDLTNIGTALDAFVADTGRFPATAEGIGILVNPPAGVAGWKGPYLKRVPVDPWGRPYVYQVGGPKGGGGYTLLCLGADGKGGTGDDIDLPYDAPATGPATTQPGLPAR